MKESRRQFLTQSSLGVLAALTVARDSTAATPDVPAAPASTPPGMPSAFATSPAAGPDVSAATFAAAEKLVQVKWNDRDLKQAAGSWRVAMAPLYERRTGPKKLALEEVIVPASRWNPQIPQARPLQLHRNFVRSASAPEPLPKRDEDIAFASVAQLSLWIEQRQLSSQRLTQIYLDRLRNFDPRLKCVITLTADLALAQAKQAHDEIAAGKYRGALHGIPWGAKDLLDTAGIRTTYGAEPFKDRIPQADAFVVRRLREAVAVLVAKLSLGALALNDVWFGGQTVNPWLTEEGASGSSAGPGAATAAGVGGVSVCG